MKIKIYQIDIEKDIKHAKFCGLKDLRQLGASIQPENYKEVFDGEVDCKTLENVYELFNLNHPPTHRGHSLSVSDIIHITENTDNYLHGCFFCDSIGFESIEFDTSKTFKPDNLLRVVMLEPDKPAYEAEIADELRAFQHAVRGRIERVYPFEDNAALVANEEGLIHDMDANRTINGKLYVGPLFIIGVDDDGEFCSLTEEQIQKHLEAFSKPEFVDENPTPPKDEPLRVIKTQGGMFYELEMADTKKAIRNAIGGDFKVSTPFKDESIAIISKDVAIVDFKGNLYEGNDLYAEPMIFVGDDGNGNFCSLTDVQMEKALAMIRQPEQTETTEPDENSGMTMS